MSYCKEFLKAFRKTVGAKPEEKIDKRYSGWLAPNNKAYGNAHCGYCAEVKYLSDIYDKEEMTSKHETIKFYNDFLEEVEAMKERIADEIKLIDSGTLIKPYDTETAGNYLEVELEDLKIWVDNTAEIDGL